MRAYGSMISSTLVVMAGQPGPHQTTAVMLLDEARQMQAPFVQPLTAQERAVLRLLATLMTNSEIAAAMHLSINTIKTHLKALYRKLGVERRRDAVVRARQLEII
jgi:LuxR family maltose regulon positive regulatory protein